MFYIILGIIFFAAMLLSASVITPEVIGVALLVGLLPGILLALTG